MASAPGHPRGPCRSRRARCRRAPGCRAVGIARRASARPRAGARGSPRIESSRFRINVGSRSERRRGVGEDEAMADDRIVGEDVGQDERRFGDHPAGGPMRVEPSARGPLGLSSPGSRASCLPPRPEIMDAFAASTVPWPGGSTDRRFGVYLKVTSGQRRHRVGSRSIADRLPGRRISIRETAHGPAPVLQTLARQQEPVRSTESPTYYDKPPLDYRKINKDLRNWSRTFDDYLSEGAMGSKGFRA